MSEFRTERLGRLIQEKIGVLILEGKIKDPRVSPFLSITRVSVSRDLSFADVYVSNIADAGKSREGSGPKRGAEGLQSAAGFIQSQLGSVLHIRKTPRLRFHADTGIREEFELIQKIDKLVVKSGDSGI